MSIAHTVGAGLDGIRDRLSIARNSFGLDEVIPLECHD